MKKTLSLISLTAAMAFFGLANALAQNANPAITIEQLRTMIANGGDVTGVNTSQITDMSELFRNNSTFNQDISSLGRGQRYGYEFHVLECCCL